jgi:hypothetical protein
VDNLVDNVGASGPIADALGVLVKLAIFSTAKKYYLNH